MTKADYTFAAIGGAVLALVVWIGATIYQSHTYVDDYCSSQSFDKVRVFQTTPDSQYLPDSGKTPGAFWREVTVDQIKQKNYSKKVRDVPESRKKFVAAGYGMKADDLKKCEVDHLVPLSWGGSNVPENLWPQPYEGEWGARVKDKLEVHGLKMIRDEELSLREAQKEIATDWIGMYKRLIGNDPQQHFSQQHEQ